jgi:hypothetical protein
MHEGHEITTDEDESGASLGKHALDDASRSGLRHFTVKCGTDDPEIDIFTSPDLHRCHLVGNEEERRLMTGTYRWISMLKAEFMLLNEPMDVLTANLEVSGIRAIMLAWAAHLHHGHVEIEL